MDRISATATGVQLDKFGAGKHGYTNGDPDTGVGATIPQASAFDAVQEEIMAVIEGEGFTPSPTEYNQLYAAILHAINRLMARGIGMVVWFPNRSSITAGFVPADGQVVNRSTAPAIVAALGTLPTVTDSDWITYAEKRASYSSGDGSTTFRYPDYNGQYAGDVRLFLSGDGTHAAQPGIVQKASLLIGDDVNNTINTPTNISTERAAWGWDEANMADYPGIDSGSGTRNSAGGTAADHCGTARPANVAGVWCIFTG